MESLETKPQIEQPPLLYDLTTLQREANSRHGFSASRTLSAAQALYDQHKLLTYPRTSSRFLSGDMAGQLKGVASGVGAAAPEYADAARYVLGLDRLPLGRVVNDARVGDHHAIIPTEGDHDLSGLGRDERRIYDMVARRFLAVFHPPARFERTVVETRVGDHLPQPWQGHDRGRLARGLRRGGEHPGRRQGGRGEGAGPPALAVGQTVRCADAEALAKQTKPPARYSEGTLLRAMETAGKLVDDDEAAEAMKDAGIGTPALRAATIERLVEADYVERGPQPAGHREGRRPRQDARRPPAHLAGAHRPLGAAPQPHRARRGACRGLPPRDRRLHARGGRVVRRQGSGRP